MEIQYKRPKLTAYQRLILDCEERYTITEASTKSGKTASHIVWLFEQALRCSNNQSVWWVAPVYGQAEIAFRRMKSQVSNKKFFKVNESKLTLTLPTGAMIQFKSAEKPDNLYGDDVYAAVFDEASRAREESWFALRSTLTATRGKCKLIGNSKGKKNWMYRLGQRALSGEENYRYFKITAYDAAKEGVISFEEIEQAKRDLPEHVFKELYLCEPAEDGANPFGINFIQQQTTHISHQQAVVFGIDLAKSYDYTVIVGLDQFGRVCHFDRFQADWGQTKQRILSTIVSTPTLIDSTGVGDSIVEDLQRNSRNVEGFKFTASSKQELMEGLAMALQQGNLWIIDGVMKSELEQFEFQHSSTGVKYSAPSGMHDDCVCALALAARKFFIKTGRKIIIL